MGSYISISGITINFHHENAVYFTDEPLSGVVKWINQNGTIRTKEIYVMFIGEIAYKTQEVVSTGTFASTIRARHHHIQFYSSKVSLAKAQSEEEKIVFPQGEYSWPFQFFIADHVPPTVNLSQHYPHIRYYLQVGIEKFRYKPNTKELRHVTVFPRISLLQNPQWLQPTLFAEQNRKEISLRAIINKIGLVPGEPVELTIEIDNPRAMLIKSITFSIYQSLKFDASLRRQTVLEVKLKDFEDVNRRQIQKTFSVRTDALVLPPSYEYQGGIERLIFVQIRYFLRLDVKVAGLFADFDLVIPLIVGTEPRLQSYQPSAAILPDDDLPPSYDSVVRNAK